MSNTSPRSQLQAQERGFSLVELLIVVAIIGIVAALAIPNLMQSRQAACSASAISALRLIHSSQSSFRTSTGQYGDLTALANANIISDPSLRIGTKSSYNFTVTPDAAAPNSAYAGLATPANPNTAVWRHYFVDATGVLRWNMGAPATATDSILDN